MDGWRREFERSEDTETEGRQSELKLMAHKEFEKGGKRRGRVRKRKEKEGWKQII